MSPIDTLKVIKVKSKPAYYINVVGTISMKNLNACL